MGLVTVRRQGAAAVVTYANPPFGTMTAAGVVEMFAAVERPRRMRPCAASSLTGGLADIFVRHYDVGELADLSDLLASMPTPAPGPVAEGRAPARSVMFGDLVAALAAAPKPVIAAINGLCMGGGFEIALACDLRIAGETVSAIGLPEVRIGIYPGGGGTQRLPRIIGEAKALEFILRGRTVSAVDALAIGLVHETAADPLARALDLAAEFASRPPEGLAYAKRLTRAALDRPLAEGLADESRSFVALLRDPSVRAPLRRAAQPGVLIQTL